MAQRGRTARGGACYHPSSRSASPGTRTRTGRSASSTSTKNDGDGTRLDLYHEGEGIADDGAGDKRRWDDALGRFVSTLP